MSTAAVSLAAGRPSRAGAGQRTRAAEPSPVPGACARGARAHAGHTADAATFDLLARNSKFSAPLPPPAPPPRAPPPPAPPPERDDDASGSGPEAPQDVVEGEHTPVRSIRKRSRGASMRATRARARVSASRPRRRVALPAARRAARWLRLRLSALAGAPPLYARLRLSAPAAPSTTLAYAPLAAHRTRCLG